MEDIKPREVAWRFDGRDWVLRCNNNVLAEVQIVNGGNFGPVLSRKRTLKSVLQLLAAMLNDYADEQKWVDEKGFAITMPAEVAAHTYVAGAKCEGERLLTSGGRVLGVTATAADLKSAVKKAYERVERVHFDNAFYRHDIGQRALKALEH